MGEKEEEAKSEVAIASAAAVLIGRKKLCAAVLSVSLNFELAF